MLDYPRGPRGPRSAAGKKLAAIEGTIPMQIASEAATVTFHQPLDRNAPMIADVGADRLLLKSFTRDASGQFNLTMVLARGQKETDPHWKVLSELISRFAMRIVMVCPKGTVKHTQGGGDWQDTEVRTQLQFPPRDPDDQPTDVQVVMPAAFGDVTAKFAFKDLPMP
jgi:hypothetical protein